MSGITLIMANLLNMTKAMLRKCLMESRDFWNNIFGLHVVKRLTNYLDPNHLKSWDYYIVSSFKIVVRSGAFLAYPIGLWFLVRNYVAERDPGITILFAWYIVPIIAMSLMTSKLLHYMYPYLPPLALVSGVGLARLMRVRPNFGYYWKVASARWITATLDAFPIRWLLFALAVAPVILAYSKTLNAVRLAPRPFTALQACLQEVGGVRSAGAFFGEDQLRNHVFRYYGFAEHLDISPDLVKERALGDEPIWLPESEYRVLLASDPRAEAIEAHRMPLSRITNSGEVENAILLLPGKYAGCGAVIEKAGSIRLVLNRTPPSERADGHGRSGTP
jgi:hypothetical protein